MDYRYLDRIAGVESRVRPVGEHPLCASCGYDLFGSVSSRCPECGHDIDSLAIREHSDEIKAQLHEFEESLRIVPLAWKLVAVGLILLLIRIPPYLGPATSVLFRSLGFLCGFVAFFLRMGVLRAGRLPPAVLTRKQMETRDSFIAAVDIVGGLLLMGTSIGLK